MVVGSYSVNLHRANSRFIRHLPARFHTPFSHEDLKRKLPHLLLQQASTTKPTTSLSSLQSLHALIITMGSFQFHQPIFLSNLLISCYASLGQLKSSRHVFDEMPQRNSVSYNSIINAYLHQGGEADTEAWELFTQMLVSGIKPTQYTFGSLLSSSSLDLFQGFQLHSLILKNGLLHSDAFSGTSLLGLFGRLGELDIAIQLFEEMPQESLVTWNSMISLFGHHGLVEESVYMFCQLLRGNFRPSEYSFVGVLCGFRELHYLETEFRSFLGRKAI